MKNCFREESFKDVKAFTTPNGNYVYDRETNSLLSVDTDEFSACQRVELGTSTEDDDVLLQCFREQGYLEKTSDVLRTKVTIASIVWDVKQIYS